MGMSLSHNVLLVVQARCESTRLPNKMLVPLCGQPLLLWELSRLAPLSYPLVVAIPDTPANAPLAEVCMRHGYTCCLTPGDPSDVLGRFAKICFIYPHARHIVRIGGDTPLLDPLVVKALVRYHRENALRKDPEGSGALSQAPAYTGLAAEWGDGIADCEIFTRAALFAAHHEAMEPYEREHVSPYLWERPDRFRLTHYPCPFDLSHLRASVDTPEDLVYVQIILARCLDRYGFHFGWREVAWTVEQDTTLLAYMARRPMNAGYLTQVGTDQSWKVLRYKT